MSVALGAGERCWSLVPNASAAHDLDRFPSKARYMHQQPLNLTIL